MEKLHGASCLFLATESRKGYLRDGEKETRCSRRIGVVQNYLEKGAAADVLFRAEFFFISAHRQSDSSEPMHTEL